MTNALLHVAGVSLYDSAPVLYMDNPIKLTKFIKALKPNTVFDKMRDATEYLYYHSFAVDCDKAPYLGFIAQFMTCLNLNVSSKLLTNLDIEPIVMDFVRNMDALQKRLMVEDDIRHGFVRWYRANDVVILVVVRKGKNPERLNMFLGMVRHETLPDALWDKYFAALQKAGG